MLQHTFGKAVIIISLHTYVGPVLVKMPRLLSRQKNGSQK